MGKLALNKNRIIAAYCVAILADLIEFPITAAEVTIVAAPPAEGVAFIVDAVVFGIMTKLLGFHWAFLPSFLVELVPGLDLFPTWVGCVFFVVRQRRKEQLPVITPKALDNGDVIDV